MRCSHLGVAGIHCVVPHVTPIPCRVEQLVVAHCAGIVWHVAVPLVEWQLGELGIRDKRGCRLYVLVLLRVVYKSCDSVTVTLVVKMGVWVCGWLLGVDVELEYGERG